jgi:hypothetical protein
LRFAFHAVIGAVAVLIYAAFVIPAARVRRLRGGYHAAGPRVLWGPIPIIGIRYASLADRSQNIASTTLVYDVYSINKLEDFDLVLNSKFRSSIIQRVMPYLVFLWASLKFDIFCFYFDGGLLYATPWWRVELGLLKAAGCKIVVVPYGGDARLASHTRSIEPWNILTDVAEGTEDRDEHSVRVRRQTFARFADAMLGCADIVEDLPRVDGVFRFPYDTARAAPAASVGGGAIVVVHAPNHPHYKGTKYLVDAVAQLRSEGYPIELDLIQQMPNSEALRRYAAADIAADQFLAGAYALFAIEAMALGKPVLSYLNERFLPWHPEWRECPIVSASPDVLTERLRSLVVDRTLRERLGRAGPANGERLHWLESVGRDHSAIYRTVMTR